MPLALPSADQRSFASLMADAKARIPRLAPGWTDHNAHDPGITLLELLAWLTETDLFRAARVSEASRRAFLRWFGLELRGPTVARAIVILSQNGAPPATDADAPWITIPADTVVTDAPRDLVFTTAETVTVQPARLVAVWTGASTALVDRSAMHARRESFAAFGARGIKGDALYLGFDRRLLGELHLYVWTGAPDHDDEMRRRLDAESQSSGVDWLRHYGVETVWEVLTADGWSPVETRADETRALTLSGKVRLSIDAINVAGGPDAARFFLRCRIARERFDCPPTIAAIVVNAVEVRHQSRPFTAPLLTSDGRAGQGARVANAPLVETATHILVRWKDPDLGSVEEEEWPIVRSWDRVGPDEPAAVIDGPAGEIHFGNGRAGRVPRAGATIAVTSRRGSGAAGNVAAGSLTRFAPQEGDPRVSIAQPFTACGGADAESLPDLQGRLLDYLAHPARAVSATDLTQIARETPGVPVARVRVLPEHHPHCPGLPAAGCVTVVVVPGCEGPRPEPTGAMLAAVCRYLAPRRPLATELHVVGPIYTAMAVHARLHVAPGTNAAVIRERAAARLNAFVHPLTGGPEREGWPPGRAVYRAEIFAVLQGTPDVLWVDELLLVSGEGDGARTYCGNLVICPTSLIAVAAHAIRVVEVGEANGPRHD